ncbi:MAG: hypothetical protein Q9224_003679 [Gallowayella concinna]
MALSRPTTVSASPTPTACLGKTYSIQATDDCHAISKSQGIGTGWLLIDNQLPAYCAEFPKTGSLCLLNTCQVYSVEKGDTCKSIAVAHNITTPQLVAWNPVLDAGCNNIGKMNGSQVCVSSPGRPYVTPTVSLVAPTIASTAAPVPSDVAAGVNQRCGKFYHVVTGDYCNMIVIKFQITMDDFIFLNPSINSNCTNLLADESYCVQAVGDINTYSGRAGYSSPTATQGSITGKYNDLPDATYVSPTVSPTSIPLASGTRADCNDYFNGDVFQNDIAGTNWNSKCDLAAATFDVNLLDFGTWNTGSSSSHHLDCPANSGPGLGDEGASANCTEYANIKKGWTCQGILRTYGLTIAQFFAYNPAVKSDCSGLWLGMSLSHSGCPITESWLTRNQGYKYCVRAPGFEASTTSGSATVTTSGVGNPAPSATAPVQPGQPSNCNKWHTIKFTKTNGLPTAGDSCATVENANFITHAQFRKWNPAVSEDCSTGFWLGK